MIPSFQKIFDQLELQRSTILNQVKNLSIEKYNHSPGPGKWSISQILTHIVTAEGLSVGYMKKKAQAIAELGNSGVKESLVLMLLKISQRTPALKFRAPKVVVENTPPALPFEELSKKWDVQRNDLKNFLESIEDKNAKKLLYKHPVAGRLDARQAAVFFGEHITHHWPQIKRLLHQK